MLNYVSVKNFALLEDILLEFSGGLNALTGETGAGKTIVVDALGLVLGDKASAQQVRKGAVRLTVVAGFGDLSPRVKRLLRDLNLADDTASGDATPDGELLLRREVDSGGRSRCFVNDNPVNLSTVARLGELLVYVHGQHEHQLLLKPAEQMDLLDTLGHLESQRDAVLNAYTAWRDLVSQQQALSLSDQERAQRIDLYRFQKQELSDAKLKNEAEEEELERLLPQLKNAERLKTAAQEAYGLLYGNEGSALDKVRRVQRSLETLRGQGADLNDVAEMMEEAVVRLEESSHRIDDFQNKVDLDPNRLDEVHTRLDLLSRLKHKYGPTLRDVLVYRAKIDEELKVLENVEERTRDLTQKLASAEAELNSASGKLSAARTAAAKKLAAAVEKEFREVGLAQAEFDVSIDTTVPPSFSAVGIDEVRFLFSPNPGEGRQSLAAVASGGELSRVMLAIKSVLAKADAVPTLVFDEIDAGVGGALGTAVGKKLAKLGKTHQVLCITHLASIAAFAQTHFAVQKEIRKERTVTQVKKLQGDDRVAEIARMFGGVADTSTESSVSVRHARELLASAKIQ